MSIDSSGEPVKSFARVAFILAVPIGFNIALAFYILAVVMASGLANGMVNA